MKRHYVKNKTIKNEILNLQNTIRQKDITILDLQRQLEEAKHDAKNLILFNSSYNHHFGTKTYSISVKLPEHIGFYFPHASYARMLAERILHEIQRNLPQYNINESGEFKP
jgi:uncharacterized membrane protein